MSQVELGPVSWERMTRAAEEVRQRLLRAARTLEQAGVTYSVAGDNAVAAWVSRVDESAVRNTQDVDILIRRDDLEAAKTALTSAGFVYRHAASIDMFLDGPEARAREAVHIVFAGEKVRHDHLLPAPDAADSEPAAAFRIVTLQSLVRMKLVAFRDKDRVHLRDLIDVGLVDASWPGRFPPEISSRLSELLENPDG